MEISSHTEFKLLTTWQFVQSIFLIIYIFFSLFYNSGAWGAVWDKGENFSFSILRQCVLRLDKIQTKQVLLLFIYECYHFFNTMNVIILIIDFWFSVYKIKIEISQQVRFFFYMHI